MATVAQITANKQNALASTGPRTDEGKRIVSMNPVQHGCSWTGRHVILPGEAPAEYDALRDGFIQELGGTQVRRTFCVQMAEARWLLVRIETRKTMLIGEHGFEAPELKLLDRYERTASSKFHRALNAILAMDRAELQRQALAARAQNQSRQAKPNRDKSNEAKAEVDESMAGLMAEVDELEKLYGPNREPKADSR